MTVLTTLFRSSHEHRQVLKFKAAKGSNPGQKMHGEDTLKVPLPPWAFDTCLGRSNLPSLLLLERSA